MHSGLGKISRSEFFLASAPLGHHGVGECSALVYKGIDICVERQKVVEWRRLKISKSHLLYIKEMNFNAMSAIL